MNQAIRSGGSRQGGSATDPRVTGCRRLGYISARKMCRQQPGSLEWLLTTQAAIGHNPTHPTWRQTFITQATEPPRCPPSKHWHRSFQACAEQHCCRPLRRPFWTRASIINSWATSRSGGHSSRTKKSATLSFHRTRHPWFLALCTYVERCLQLGGGGHPQGARPGHGYPFLVW